MLNLLKHKYLSGALAGAVLLLLCYYLWQGTGQSPLLSQQEGPSPMSQEILTTLGKLSTIRLDTAVFTDPVFLSLTDFGVTIPPQAAGRRNPFAPVGTGGAFSTTTPAR